MAQKWGPLHCSPGRGRGLPPRVRLVVTALVWNIYPPQHLQLLILESFPSRPSSETHITGMISTRMMLFDGLEISNPADSTATYRTVYYVLTTVTSRLRLRLMLSRPRRNVNLKFTLKLPGTQAASHCSSSPASRGHGAHCCMNLISHGSTSSSSTCSK